ncbi:MAG: tRNA pseudouridine(38-40) synthase TruA [Planctomycetota bacterium]|jgi:tRNA pseudouridine38-40 synthase
MQRNVLLLAAYDGTAFHGWQTQAGQRTVQQMLEQSLMRVVRHPVNLIGCSRTDAGVHALGHVSNFRTTHTLDVFRFRHAIGSRLPDDLSVVALRDVDPAFHATRSARSKMYRYRIHNAQHRPVENLSQRYVYHFWKPLDETRMQQAAHHFVGTIDFRAMASRSGEKDNTVRTVLRCEIRRMMDEIIIEIEGTGFLYNQVRNMVGTLINVGRGYWPPDHVVEILESRDRTNAGQKAPAKGLTLCWVRYPPELLGVPANSSNADSGSIVERTTEST